MVKRAKQLAIPGTDVVRRNPILNDLVDSLFKESMRLFENHRAYFHIEDKKFCGVCMGLRRWMLRGTK